jgi:hypothetical protein
MFPWSKRSFLGVVCGFALAAGCGFRAQTGVIPRGGAGGASGVSGMAGTSVAGTNGGAGTRIIITGEGGTIPMTGAGGSSAGGTNGGTSTIDANCGAKDKPAMKLLPDILIVLDRSGSMNDDIKNQQCTGDGGIGARDCGLNSKWAKVTPAITQVVTETEMDVNWGLKFFPDNSNNSDTCSVSNTAAVPIGPANGAAVAAAITGATDTTGGVLGYQSTPTRSGVNGAVTYLKTLTTMNPKYVLLATDGLPNCAASGAGGTGGRGGGATGTMTDDSAGATTAVASALTAGYKTFVVGIATAGVVTNMVNADMTLSNMANAGGLPRSGSPTYYPVSSGTELADAIRKLITQVNTCTFQVGPTPTSDGTTSLGLINVFGDGVEIKRDTTHTDGYDYADPSMNSIQIYGPTCEQVMSAGIKNVTVTFRCIFG